MKLFEIPMVVTSLVGLGFLAGLGVPAAHADFTFGAPVDVLSALPSGDCIDCFSADGLEAYIESDRAGGQGNYDLWVYKRASVEDGWGPLENLGAVNKPAWDAFAALTGDGLELYFASGRSVGGAYGGGDLYVTKRTTRDSPWAYPTNLGPNVNTSSLDSCSSVSSDGLELYFVSNRPGGYGGMDLYVSKRATRNDPWGPAANLGPTVNGPGEEAAAALSPDGLLLLFQDNGTRPGGLGGSDLWMTRRPGPSAPWEPVVNLGPTINRPTGDYRPCFAPGGSALYFLRDDIAYWKAPILPIMDFNADGKVDAADMVILADNWGKSTTLCDIGPYAWGDGVVDEKDLKVLMESLMTPGPEAGDVPCDVVMNWTGPSFAESYDVYFGTSLNDVSNATREDPCGVLVSEGQPETTYDPNGLLGFSRTYYWRVDVIDVVVGSLEPIIYKGPVLSFTTEPFARPIQNIIATASGSQPGMGPQNTVNGIGLDQNDGHSISSTNMWQSTATPGPHWIQYEFDQVYTLHELWVWNSNQVIEPILGFGAKTVKVEYSTDGTAWTALQGALEFTRAPGQAGYSHNTVVSFGGVSAKYVKLTIEKGWGNTPSVGLSEVRFFYIPDRPATNP